MNEYGVVTQPGTVRLERLLPGPIERVWDYLTDSNKRGTWFASGPIELRVGGKVELKFHHADLSAEKEIPERFKEKCAGNVRMNGVVTACDPPRLLSYTFGDAGEVSFELTPKGKDVLLVLTHRGLADRKMMVGVSSGWHSHLAILTDVLNGDEPRPFWTTVTKMEAEYERRIPN
ncbi:MAG TPA: SRPBCC family protein [Methyloceanibacter sp.]|nr:SRPBCC family protein [Methyloceanibacter sp.]